MKYEVKILRKYRNHEAMSSQGTKRRRNDNTNATYETTDALIKKNCNRRAALEQSVGKQNY